MNQSYPSQLLENAVNEFAKLPGIGRKTALRLVLYLIRQDKNQVDSFAEAMIKLRNDVKYCSICRNISDDDICNICANPGRDSKTICVVENVKDVMVIENTLQYKGLYHVLGGIISPMEGIGPGDLEIDSLVKRAASENVEEIILALSATMEGDTTNFYIFRKLSGFHHLKVSIIARGVSIGDELEYTDEITLGRSIVNRTLFNDSFKSL
ncbi:MAG: recombination mediator RecR [Candidatus Azobacteroides sp.]|nr:recombination mediator RecR [Candidatus Azobacteroides sp.]